ncbi:Lactonase, 7-bladed beta-propeller-domain-containing protein [Phialemonium atrogriseum]|uniref:Lactonase, 7-bladed beta-propeller-domain-containing protein n=1 Tax=Phialemonium atrogriseum TaxID=1093897 RepID=A0AAJ0FQH0_9PEZI|nr:Lactonase, 7-bladed beta-propeller-domain-containing protein [Phialemonium atrogriseum]KAK1771268.1 Lactonase, 7-bladed beta-propeller-domain-containing protein [Phialemonium atrogriseum]
MEIDFRAVHRDGRWEMEISKSPWPTASAVTATLPGHRSRRRRCLFTNLTAAVVVAVLALVPLTIFVVSRASGIRLDDANDSGSSFASKFLHLVHLVHMPDTAAAMALRSLLTAGTLAFGLPSATSASLLYVSSYAGTITTFNLSLSNLDHATEAHLQPIASSDGCAPNPSWLTLDYSNSTLYCLDEGLSSRNGSLSSYSTADDGTLVRLDKVTTILGPVSGVIYGTGGRGLALAEYSGSSVSSFSISDPAALAPIQSDTFTIPQPGVDPIRQNAPHPHEAFLDPTGQFLLVPDLGADLVRVFLLDGETLERTAVAPLVAAPGSGPRHGVFLVTETNTFLYLVSELTSTITVYDVLYNQNKTLGFNEVYITSIYGEGASTPKGATASEIQISPDSKFLIVASRDDGRLKIPSFDPEDSTEIPSDPLLNFSLDHCTGALSLVQTFPAGGIGPRHFSLNKAGNLVAVGLQKDGRVVVIDRDTETGELKGFLASADVEGEVTCAIFDE